MQVVLLQFAGSYDLIFDFVEVTYSLIPLEQKLDI